MCSCILPYRHDCNFVCPFFFLFTLVEWNTFNLPSQDLSYNSYVKVNDSYFKPSGYNPLYWLPTGGGKTVVMAALVVRLASEGKCSLIIGHRNEIFDQFESMLKKFGCNPAVISQKRVNEKGSRIVLAMIRTLEKRSILFEPSIDYVVIDEAHHANSKSYTGTLEKLCADARYVGVRATPLRTDGAGLSHAGFDTLVTGPPVAQLIKDGFLVKPEYLAEHLIDTTSVLVKGADYEIRHLSERARAATDAIVQTYIQHAQIPSGLEWINLGASRPDGGHALIRHHLANALQRQTNFSQDE